MQTIIPAIPLADPLDDTAPHDDAIDHHNALLALYDRTVDSVKGYAKMVEKAEPSFRDTAEKFRALHARHAEDLTRLLADVGVQAVGDGTIMGTVNQAVVSFRAFFDNIDEDVMDQIRSGEDWVVKAFDAAITEQESPNAIVKLRGLQTELTDLLAETRHLG